MARVPASKRTSPETAPVSARLSPETSTSVGPVVTWRRSGFDAVVAIALLLLGGAGRYRTSAAAQVEPDLGIELLCRHQRGAEGGDQQIAQVLTRQVPRLGPVEDRGVHVAEPSLDRGA